MVDDGFTRPKKKAKGTMLDQMMDLDAEIGYTKRKFREIQVDKAKSVKNRRYRKLRREILKGQKKLKTKLYR